MELKEDDPSKELLWTHKNKLELLSPPANLPVEFRGQIT